MDSKQAVAVCMIVLALANMAAFAAGITSALLFWSVLGILAVAAYAIKQKRA
ncbi:hypothetical protein HY491_04875 [Candidatus Woesearchaeota archaeon]|nr:hypothetical protein [Candidatus Woesearchaeota archaeon]